MHTVDMILATILFAMVVVYTLSMTVLIITAANKKGELLPVVKKVLLNKEAKKRHDEGLMASSYLAAAVSLALSFIGLMYCAVILISSVVFLQTLGVIHRYLVFRRADVRVK